MNVERRNMLLSICVILTGCRWGTIAPPDACEERVSRLEDVVSAAIEVRNSRPYIVRASDSLHLGQWPDIDVATVQVPRHSTAIARVATNLAVNSSGLVSVNGGAYAYDPEDPATQPSGWTPYERFIAGAIPPTLIIDKDAPARKVWALLEALPVRGTMHVDVIVREHLEARASTLPSPSGFDDYWAYETHRRSSAVLPTIGDPWQSLHPFMDPVKSLIEGPCQPDFTNLGTVAADEVYSVDLRRISASLRACSCKADVEFITWWMQWRVLPLRYLNAVSVEVPEDVGVPMLGDQRWQEVLGARETALQGALQQGASVPLSVLAMTTAEP